MAGDPQAVPTNEPTTSPNMDPNQPSDRQTAAPAQPTPTSGGPPTVAQQPPPPTGADDSPAPAARPQQQGVPTQAPAGPVTPVASSEPARVEGQTASEPTMAGRPPIDPRPYAMLAQNHPDVADVVDKSAQVAGVAPQTIAAHMLYENNFKMADAPTSKTGAVGPMQIEPGTAREINQRFGTSLDPSKPEDNVQLGAYYIRMMEDKYGVGTPASTLAYVAGPGNVDKIAANPQLASQFPDSMKYVNNIHGVNVDPSVFAGAAGSNMTPRGIVLAGTHGGPGGMLSYIAQSKPQDMTMSDAWQHAESMLVGNFAMRGDMDGAAKAQQFVFNMSHQGSNMALMGAYRALNAGDGVSTAKFLAAAHAFFPDGGMGQFGVDSKGQVWGQNMDEQNPTKPLGQPFQVTPQAIAGMLNQTADPQSFLQTLQKQQTSNAQARMYDQHGAYYGGLNEEREHAADERAQTQLQVEHERAQTQLQIAQQRTGGGNASVNNAINKEVETNYGSDAMPSAAPETRMQLSQVHTDMRKNGADPITANVAATNLISGKYAVRPQSDGTYAVVDPKNPTTPIATVSASVVNHLAGAKGIEPGAKSTSPIAAGGGSPVAAMGMTTNLAGSQPSQAGTPPPQQPQQAVPTGT